MPPPRTAPTDLGSGRTVLLRRGWTSRSRAPGGKAMSQRAHGITAAAGEHCAIWVGDVGGREAAMLIWKSENPSGALSP